MALSKSAAAGFLYLLSASAIGAIGIALIAAQRWTFLLPEETTKLLLVLQWHAFGVLICKVGLDLEVLALVTRDRSKRVGIYRAIAFPVFPVTVAFSLLLGSIFSFKIALVLCAAIILDVCAVLRSAELNAKLNHTTAAIGTLLNYPLFFLFVGLYSQIWSLNLTTTIVLFAASSLARLLWLEGRVHSAVAVQVVALRPTATVAAQPVLNSLLFRSDQLLLALPFAAVATSSGFLAEYIFLAKFSELVGAVLVVLGVVVFPRVSIVRTNTIEGLVDVVRHHWHLCALAVVVLVVGAIGYAAISVNAEFPVVKLLPFVIHAALVFPVNLLTFLLYQHGRANTLVRSLLMTSMLGSLVLAVIAQIGALNVIAWVVPGQLLAFIVLGLISYPRNPHYSLGRK